MVLTYFQGGASWVRQELSSKLASKLKNVWALKDWCLDWDLLVIYSGLFNASMYKLRPIRPWVPILQLEYGIIFTPAFLNSAQAKSGGPPAAVV